MSRIFRSILLLFSLLLSLPGGAWGVSSAAPGNRICGFSANPATPTWEIGSQVAGAHWGSSPCGYECATDVGAYVNQNPWSKFDPLGLKKKRDYKADYDKAKARYDELGARKVEGMSISDGLKVGSEMMRLQKAMDSAQKGIDNIEDTAKSVNQAIDALNWVQRKLGKEKIPFSIDSEALDDESADHRWAFEASSDWSRFKFSGAATAISGGIAASTKLAGLLVSRGTSVGAAGGVAFRLGKPVTEIPRYEWAMMSHEQRIAAVVEKYGINLRGGQVVFDPKLETGQLGMTPEANPTVMRVGSGVMNSETELASTIAHELRHSRAYMGSGSNTEAAAEASEKALRNYIQGGR